MEGFGKLINPGTDTGRGISVNGITDEMLKDAPPIESILSEFAEFCGEIPLVAHNASFDFKFLLSDVKRLKGQVSKPPVLDTLSLARKVFPGMANYKLWTLVRHLIFRVAPFIVQKKIVCMWPFVCEIVETIELRRNPLSTSSLREGSISVPAI